MWYISDQTVRTLHHGPDLGLGGWRTAYCAWDKWSAEWVRYDESQINKLLPLVIACNVFSSRELYCLIRCNSYTGTTTFSLLIGWPSRVTEFCSISIRHLQYARSCRLVLTRDHGYVADIFLSCFHFSFFNNLAEEGWQGGVWKIGIQFFDTRNCASRYVCPWLNSDGHIAVVVPSTECARSLWYSIPVSFGLVFFHKSHQIASTSPDGRECSQ